MKAILKSLFVIAVVGALAIGASRAYFSDQETSTGNTFVAGTIDLAVNDENPWTTGFSFSDIKPSQDLGKMLWNFKNVGQNEGNLRFTLQIASEADKDDDCPTDPADFEFYAAGMSPDGCSLTDRPEWEMDEDQFAKLLYLKSAGVNENGAADAATCGEVPQLWLDYADANGDGKLSFYEMAQKEWTRGIPPTLTPLDVDQIHGVCVEFHLGDVFDTCEEGQTWPVCATNYAIQTGKAWNVPQADGLSASVTATLSQVGAP